MYNRDANRSRRKMTARTPLRANTKTRDELDTLGRDNSTKRGPKSDKDDGPKYTPEQRRLLSTYGKYVRLFGDIKETLTVSQLEEFFVII
jgi:hypothetical protein